MTEAVSIATPKNCPTGFSFTTMFFGPFPVLFRGNWRLALALLVVFIASLIPFLGWLMLPMFFIAPAVVNRLHATDQFNPFPMEAAEIQSACVYFGIWLVLAFLGFMVLGAAFFAALS